MMTDDDMCGRNWRVLGDFNDLICFDPAFLGQKVLENALEASHA